MRRLGFSLFVMLLLGLTWAAPAFAQGGDNGEGLVGETDDAMITFFSLGVILFFPLVALIGTLLESRSERRKEAKKEAQMRQRAFH